MAPKRWISVLVPASTLVLCALLAAGAAAGASDSTDLATQFVADLIANVTGLMQQQQAEVESSRSCSNDDPLVVDLGYAKYRGYHNATTGLNYWKGIPFAAPPTGNLRWQPPQMLPPNPDAPIVNASAFGPVCPQSPPSSAGPVGFIPGDEDCLYLNVYAPPQAVELPVLVWIHGGGYGLGDGRQDMADFINANNQSFLVVAIQYRLGAFGWLSSAEVKKRGVVNAGMLDQVFALAWVKTHVRRFGGDPDRVTISGESGGAGSVMYHGIALEGTLGDLLFRQGIAASPYLPFQYDYDDALPTKRYYTFAKFAGCPGSGDVFDCLVGKDTLTLQVASANVTQTAVHGYWGFWPVTDGSYIVNRPSQQLLTGRVNGRRVLVGHNANEGSFFVPRNITTEADLVNWLSGSEFPNLSPAQIDAILAANPNSAPTDPAGPHFATDGRGTAAAGDTVVQVAPDANGQLQRASNIYAEALFVNLNETGGTPYTTQLYWGPTVTQMAEPGLRNAFGLGSGVTWEGGRKARCDVYLSLADSIPL
ncbi:uncharacterized protein THITE_2053903 [Thermothielavioides terrestris NRRL 8126]|uniref:Carboxylic ester hydrolase n=1 Tax=Thermothielavioides terrestris (strain ATCC 38088 / NRRL 8126) TaxID=578455 RepID=G2R945_THETT|nr:uncharacterized protein THITE_2053903 [Thermothielavioides terrestris NRRL 8126]AEO68640.1 hypothetical protein THITE_2053903 [Thermothielavioides terrestris NRRL 8126]